MKKKTYQTPRVIITRAALTHMLCASNVINNVGGNSGIGYGGGGSGPARIGRFIMPGKGMPGTGNGDLW